MEKNIKIATWNLCLGLTNKKDLVTNYLKSNDISACCLQETEVPPGYPIDILNCNNFNLELEACDGKKRAGIYIKDDVIYTRRADLEKKNCHVLIVDLDLSIKVRLINVYCSFCPPDGLSGMEFLNKQLSVIRDALCKDCYIMGDFNLNGGLNLSPEYYNKNLLNVLNLFATEFELTTLPAPRHLPGPTDA